MNEDDHYDYLLATVGEMVHDGYSNDAILAELGDDEDRETLIEIINNERGLF
jgi:hypothetical protein